VSELAVARSGVKDRRQPRRFGSVLIWVCWTIVLIVLACAIFGELIAPQSPDAQDLALGVTPPSGDHLLGTDELGRDVLSRVIVGARTAVIGPVLIALGGTLIGLLLGLMAGYAGGWLDTIILRWADLMFALPGHLVAIVVVGVLGGGYGMAIVVLIVLSSPYDTRLMRAATLEQRPRPYVEAARLLGLPGRRVALQHIWPNLVPLVMASGFLGFAYGLLALSALSFLGLGVGPGTADWGRMLAESLVLIFSNPAGALAPGGLIVLTAASVNLIGDWLEEVLSDRGRAR